MGNQYEMTARAAFTPPSGLLPQALTARQREVLDLLEGLQNKHISPGA